MGGERTEVRGLGVFLTFKGCSLIFFRHFEKFRCWDHGCLFCFTFQFYFGGDQQFWAMPYGKFQPFWSPCLVGHGAGLGTKWIAHTALSWRRSSTWCSLLKSTIEWSTDFHRNFDVCSQQYGCWTKIGGWNTPKMDGENFMENPIKHGMIWGYHYFWKYPYWNNPLAVPLSRVQVIRSLTSGEVERVRSWSAWTGHLTASAIGWWTKHIHFPYSNLGASCRTWTLTSADLDMTQESRVVAWFEPGDVDLRPIRATGIVSRRVSVEFFEEWIWKLCDGRAVISWLWFLVFVGY